MNGFTIFGFLVVIGAMIGAIVGPLIYYFKNKNK